MAKFYDVKVAYSVDGEAGEQVVKTAASTSCIALKVARSQVRDDRPGAKVLLAEVVWDNEPLEKSHRATTMAPYSDDYETGRVMDENQTEVTVEQATPIVFEGQPEESVVEERPGGPRRLKVGEFRRARAAGKLGRIYSAIEGQPCDLQAVAALVGLTDGEVETALKGGRRSHGVDYYFTEDAERIVLIYPPGETTAVLPAVLPRSGENGASPRRIENRAPKGLAEFRQVRPGTIRERIIGMADGTRTAGDIAAALGLTEVNTKSHIFCLWRDCGMGYEYADGGLVRVVLPEGASGAVKSAEAVPADPAA